MLAKYTYVKHRDPAAHKYNIKITSKNYKFLRHYILGTYNPNLTELILKPVLMYLNVFSY